MTLGLRCEFSLNLDPAGAGGGQDYEWIKDAGQRYLWSDPGGQGCVTTIAGAKASPCLDIEGQGEVSTLLRSQ